MELQEEDQEDNSVGFDPLVDLPLDIAQLIFHRMNFTARLRVPAVCRSWRELSANHPTPPPTVEQPWMLLRDHCCPTFRLVHLSMPTPPAHHRHSPPAVFGDHRRLYTQTDIVAGCHGQFLILVVPHFNCIYTTPFPGNVVPSLREPMMGNGHAFTKLAYTGPSSPALPSGTHDGE